jgi:hypothetical protein
MICVTSGPLPVTREQYYAIGEEMPDSPEGRDYRACHGEDGALFAPRCGILRRTCCATTRPWRGSSRARSGTRSAASGRGGPLWASSGAALPLEVER